MDKKTTMQQLEQTFFMDTHVQEIAQKLLGKIILTNINGIETACRIVETEAYAAPEDKASHAYNFRRTKRTETMYMEGGHSYVYLCYGIHHLFNVVTGPSGLPHAILIRGGEPIHNITSMLVRRNKTNLSSELTAGPGALSQALGITTSLDAQSLFKTSSPIKIMDDHFTFPDSDIMALPRVGINYAEEYVEKPWRFIIKGNKWVSNRDGLKHC